MSSRPAAVVAVSLAVVLGALLCISSVAANALASSSSSSPAATAAAAAVAVAVVEEEHEDMCTSFAVSPGATTDSSVLTSHTNDCLQCDFRLALTPAADHLPDAMRPVFTMRGEYPHYVGYARGPDYYPENTDMSVFPWKETSKIGEIPEVPHTYAFFDGMYGVMNEKQLAIGESTCSGFFTTKPVHAGGKALLDATELSRLAMERTSTAVEAIELMGAMAEKYGYYQCDWMGTPAGQQGVGGEALTVADGKEVWVFHILPDDTGESAIWAAQRVPDGEVAVVANDFIIKEIDTNNTNDFKYSSNMHDIARRHNLWTPTAEKPLLHFQRAFSVPRTQPLYVTRRIWRAFDQMAPSLKIHPDTALFDFPFSVKPDHKLTVQQVMDMHRDHFEGTPYDLTKGLAAGPFGDPNRFDGSILSMPQSEISKGFFERPISLHRTSHTSVTQSRHFLPDVVGGVLWFSEYAPAVSVFTPLFPAQLSLTKAYSTGSFFALDRDVAWWAFCAVGNYAMRSYSYIIQEINAAQRAWEKKLWAEQAELEAAVVAKLKSVQENGSGREGEHHAMKRIRHHITDYANGQAEAVTKSWWKLFDTIITKYHDGYRMDDLHAEKLVPTKLFYPMEWLQQVSFFPKDYSPAPTPAPTPSPAAQEADADADADTAHNPPHLLTAAAALPAGAADMPTIFQEKAGEALASLTTRHAAGAASSSSSSSSAPHLEAAAPSLLVIAAVAAIGSAIGYAVARKTDRRATYDLIA